MATPSVSFRITRSAEDLATTIHALSQRLVTLEQRLAAMEQQLTTPEAEDPQELASLENVERLLRDCRDLLDENAVAVQRPGEEDGLGEDREPEEQQERQGGYRDGYPAAA